MQHDQQFDDLVKHFSICAQYMLDAGNLKLLPEFREKLVKLRNAKDTWYGRTENEIRIVVDKFLRENP